MMRGRRAATTLVEDAPPAVDEPAGADDTQEYQLSPEEQEAAAVAARVFRVSGITYLHIPAREEYESSKFFEACFGWQLSGDPENPSFQDGTGHVLGTFARYRPPAPEAGLVAYIYVESLDETLDKVCSHGGSVVSNPFLEGDMWIATFSDPAGNTWGIWSTSQH